MNKTRRSILSVLLAIALLLPMAPMARAAEAPGTPASSVALSPATGNDIYYRSGLAGSITITATATPGNYDGTITWLLDNTALLSANRALNTALPYSSNNSIRLTAANVGNTNLRVLLQDASGNEVITNSVEIRILADSVNTLTLSPVSTTVEVGKSTTLTARAAYLSGSGTPSVTYTSSDPSVASVDARGTVRGVSSGSATITATADGKTATAAITVTEPTSNLIGNATMGADYSMQDIYDSMRLQFNTLFSGAPDYVYFTDLNRTYGTLKTGAGAAVVANDPYNFVDLRSMYFTPAATGSCTFGYTALNNIGNSLSGMITITVTTPTTHIRIPVSGSSEYRFDQAVADGSGKTGEELVRSSIGSFGSIRFGSVQSGSDTGTLFTSSAANYSDLVVNGTIVAANAINQLYFIPSRAGTYSISYTAYSNSDGTGTLVSSGTLIIAVDAASLSVVVNLDSTAAYLFSNAPRSGASSAASLLVNTINSAVGSYTWSGIRIDAASTAAASVGTLHQSSAYSRAVSSDDYIAATDIENLYFVPERAGVYEVSYSVYSSQTSTSPLALGKLTINVSNIPTGSADFSYVASTGSTVTLKESDFIDFFRNKNGSRYYLSYVTFDDYNGSNSFYHDSARFVPFNSADLYSSTYTGKLDQYAHYLDRLTFTAPKDAGFTVVRFTCHGGTAANAVTTKTSGYFYIFYTNSDVPSITYNAHNAASIELTEDDFISVYKSATKDTVVRPSFEVKLLSVPSSGTLYRYYSRTGRTTLTSGNISGYTFTVNGAVTDSVSKISYVPGNFSGSETLTYIAYDTNGTMLYIGEVVFKLGADRATTAYSDGLSFQATDFYSASDSDPVVYITFSKPASGRMYAYTSSRYVEAPADTKFYIPNVPGVNAVGDYPITSALYAPRAIQSGTATVTLNCTVYRRSGAHYEDAINVTVLSKTASTTFSDVNGSIGWSANSIDFSKRLGLVGGTSTNPPLFSPRDTMRRCDLVLILYRLAGSPAATGAMPYTDVTPGIYFYNSALWAYNNGIMNGVVTGSVYSPNGALTRQDFAQILYNYTRTMGGSTANTASIASYTDATQVSAYALDGIAWAVANGYVTSTSTSALVLEPQRAATRAEIVTLLHRYLTY